MKEFDNEYDFYFYENVEEKIDETLDNRAWNWTAIFSWLCIFAIAVILFLFFLKAAI